MWDRTRDREVTFAANAATCFGSAELQPFAACCGTLFIGRSVRTKPPSGTGDSTSKARKWHRQSRGINILQRLDWKVP